jgi:surface antigen
MANGTGGPKRDRWLHSQRKRSRRHVEHTALAILSLSLAVPALAVATGSGNTASADITSDYPTAAANAADCSKAIDDGTGKVFGIYSWCVGTPTIDKRGVAHYPDSAQYSSRNYGYRNCTDWAAWRLENDYGVPSSYVSGLGHGGWWSGLSSIPDAVTWRNNHGSPQSRGLAVDTNPAVGAAAVERSTSTNYYGHVAIIEAVSTDATTGVTTITVSEYNRAGDGNFKTETGTLSGLGFTDVVHFEKVATKTPPGVSTATTPGLTQPHSGPVIQRGDGTVDLFAINNMTQLAHRTLVQSWSSWETLGAGITSSQAVQTPDGRLHVFVINNSNQLAYRNWTITSGWSPWQVLGNGIVSGLSVAGRSTNKVDAFVINNAGDLAHITLDPNLGWSGWEVLGGGIIADQAVQTPNGTIHLFVINNSDQLAYRNIVSAWSPWQVLGNGIVSGLAVLGRTNNDADAFVINNAGDLAHITLDPNLGWSGWEVLGGGIVQG